MKLGVNNEQTKEDSLNSSESKHSDTDQNSVIINSENTLDWDADAVLSDTEDLSGVISPDTTSKRRKKVSEMLKNRKDHKLSSKLSHEAQLLQLSKEDVALKRKLLEKNGKI